MLVPDAYNIANDLLAETGLAAKGWRIELVHHFIAAGVCDYATKAIQLNTEHVLDFNTEELIQLLNHEFGHAISNDPTHGIAWAAAVRKLGGTPKEFSRRAKPSVDFIYAFAVIIASVITGFAAGWVWGVLVILGSLVALAAMSWKRFGPPAEVYKLHHTQ